MRNLLIIWMTVAFFSLPLQAMATDTPSADHAPMVIASVDGGASQQVVKEEADENISDPLEPWNRIIFTFNDLFYHGILKPVTLVYEFILPEPVRVAVKNFFHNLAMPKHFLSAVLQGKWEAAGTELSRFGINTILGGLGFFDVAETYFNLTSSDEDIGQTLGTLGMSDVIYIQWPFIGPSNLRDSIGVASDFVLNPLTYYPDNAWARTAIYNVKVVNHTSLHLGEYEDLKKASLDPYVALRDAYLQMRRDQISR
ncbi:MAG: VacJ family lipoprotein [Magnetococcales bacterium]|nr:VacJ family lipoprotein [Magnetococcales bacterium]MBF0437964.1 VacJ family lipoprotein [Magnetococcales bacterium]